MLREGYEIKGEKNLETVKGELERLNVNAKLEEAFKLARLYGGAGIVLGIPNQEPSEPLSLNNISKIEYLAVLDRYLLWPEGEVQKDVTQANFGLPEFYKVSTDQGLSIIHHSRILRFDGVPLPQALMARNCYWGDSILSRLYNCLVNFQSAYDSSAALIQDFSQGVYKLKDLSRIISGGNEDRLLKRFQLVDLSRSVLNAIVLDMEEDFERKSTNISGLPELLKLINQRLVAATDMPHTLLLGESPSGLGATGNSEKIDWYDYVKNKQETLLKPKLRQLLDILFSAKLGPTKLPNYSIEFNPLWQLDLKEKLETEKLRAEIDEKYIHTGVLDPKEVTQSRFGRGEHSHETQLDKKLREKFTETEEEITEVEFL